MGMTDIIPEKNGSLTSLSIDEIFTRYSVHSVRPLHREYHASVSKAKADLHSLVGRKYRDLIQIAEDIDQMNHMSRNIDYKLTDLSYKTTRHVLFGRNRFSKFESMSREENAKAARIASKTTIFNNILNNKLLSFDLKLQGMGHVKAHYLVHMAKVYFTVESVFKTISSKTVNTDRNFAQYKENFKIYLETKIATWLPQLFSFDKDRTNITKNTADQWLESDIVDFLQEQIEEGDDEEEKDSDYENYDELGLNKYFRVSSSPLLNYIVAYIILNNNKPHLSSLEGIARKIIDLRFHFLTKLLSIDLANDHCNSRNINFSFIIGFTESTYSCIKKYFLESSPNNLASTFRRNTSWKAYDLIGFHNWFEEETILLDVSKYVLLPDDFLESTQSGNEAFKNYIYDVFTTIVANHDTKNSLQQAETALSMFYNFLTACRKAEVHAESSDCNCFSVQAFSRENLPRNLLQFVVSLLENATAKENEFFIENVRGKVKLSFDECPEDKHSTQELFDKDMIRLIDDDFDTYFKQVFSLSSGDNENTLRRFEITSELKQWLNRQKILSALTRSSGTSLVSRIDQLFGKSHPNVKPFTLWGDFTTDLLKLRFDGVAQERYASLKLNLNQLLDDIIHPLNHPIDTSRVSKFHFMLYLIHLLRTNNDLHNDETIDSKIDGALHYFFERLFDGLSAQNLSPENQTVIDLFTHLSALDSAAGSGTVPLWPHIIVNSTFEKLSSTILASDFLNSSELFEIFLHEKNKPIFVNVKNAWLTRYFLEDWLLKDANAKSVGLKSTQTDKGPSSFEEHRPISAETSRTIDFFETEGGNVGTDNKTNEVSCEARDSTDNEDYTHVEEPFEFKDSTNAEELPNSSVLSHGQNPNLTLDRKLLTSQSRQLMANAAFVICFVTEVPLTSQMDVVQKIVEQINSLSENQIENSTLDIIIRGMNEFYKSCRDIHLPLLIN
ncbi:hypothetical protein METBIDRAFT_33073 [Metschnikowia bicuspidata var. bicuspidata NRRL YB-4993]|uniref:Uncharacterized protein n=1 Tax=Metschnikowia bicuspidata var. bicuspidata NRRL YB-4993 TaxID=869754 RepID=A0A1A0H7P9_9ASCO|nr:hypothetical protein METBIDRAFT_33073 [Metschnikowia bicuspidata var. bicuspidata NRRL YB-4993]OBA20124.1 hypothetical protein METBIDRAFT_33073 [Metschnikowia bicuspidata var. bicuspidata NRRL YB-4993]